MLVDCGGGTVDITVHEIAIDDGQHLKEVFKATGGPYGSVGNMQYVYFIMFHDLPNTVLHKSNLN